MTSSVISRTAGCSPLNRHIPVLLNECIEAFGSVCGKKNQHPVIVDGTLGGAGHTLALLNTYPSCRVLSFDYDIHAIKNAEISCADYLASNRLELFHGNFVDLKFQRSHSGNLLDGILLDLGYSTNQLLDSKYGMSFMNDPESPLDMRLARPASGQSAWDLINDCTSLELADILYAYGELHESRRIARRIKEALACGELINTTGSLAGLLTKINHKKTNSKTHPATLVFQALRIAVNDELRNLDQLLRSATLLLKPGGRLAVITFHSLEDRIVKRWGQSQVGQFEMITKKPITASREEVDTNPNSRCAKLRIYEKNET